MRRFLILIALFGCTFLLKQAYAAQPVSPAVGVTITCDCNDEVGKAYVAAVKTLLSQDAHFRQMDFQEGARRGAIRINIISMPLEDQDGKSRSALSIVMTHNGTLMHQFIETCTRIPILECAQSMVKDLRELEG